MKILLVGDTHGDRGLAHRITYHARDTGHNAVIQLGDFGFGWRTNDFGNDVWLTEVSEAAQEFKVPWMFIDGNHDNHPLLWKTDMPAGVTYMPRGSTTEINGVTVGFIGGGISVDRHWRKIGKSYWYTEEISDDEADQIADKFSNDKPKIILSHDAPASFPALKHGRSDSEIRSIWPMDALADADRHRNRFERIFRAAKPELWVHGHYHYRYNASIDGCLAVGLANPDQVGLTLGSCSLILDNGWTLYSPK